MAESAKSLTSLVLLAATTLLFAAGWNSDAHAQKRLEANLARRTALSPETAPVQHAPHSVPPQSSTRPRAITLEVDPSPLARLAPGRYRMVDAAGRTAWLTVAPQYSSGLPPRSRVTLLSIDGQNMALVREESDVAAQATGYAVR